MKTISILFLGVFLFASCSNNIVREPNLKDNQNDWDRDKLFGNVKNVHQYKATRTDFEQKQVGEAIINIETEYSDFGKIVYQKHFDSFGKLEFFSENQYNDKEHRINSVNENFLRHSKSIDRSKYDSIGNLILADVIYNDTSKYIAMFEYDSLGNLIKQTSIQNNDTTSTIFKYKYNDKGDIYIKTQFDDSGNEYVHSFVYNENGEIIESLDISEMFGKMKTIYTYDHKNRIKTIVQYRNKQIEDETYFDKYLNPIALKYYEDAVLQREMKNNYDFDNYGNWIEKKVYLKQHFVKDKKFKLIYIETRKIEYYE
jgi:hypothetical protein